MNYRTDLAAEAHMLSGRNKEGVIYDHSTDGGLTISSLHITTDSAAKRIGKDKGKYITIENLPLSEDFRTVKKQIGIIAEQLYQMLPSTGTVLVTGIGNSDITSDSLGPKSAAVVIATRHIQGELAKAAGLDGLRCTAVLAPGVLGQTGIEVGEVIMSLAEKISPTAIIAIDALASRSLAHLGRTIQLSDTGIAPGSGIGNHRWRLSESTMGIPVVSIGMPTVVDCRVLAGDILGDEHRTEDIEGLDSELMVTPKEIDLLTERASKLIGMSINCALQRNYSFEELAALL